MFVLIFRENAGNSGGSFGIVRPLPSSKPIARSRSFLHRGVKPVAPRGPGPAVVFENEVSFVGPFAEPRLPRMATPPASKVPLIRLDRSVACNMNDSPRGHARVNRGSSQVKHDVSVSMLSVSANLVIFKNHISIRCNAPRNNLVKAAKSFLNPAGREITPLIGEVEEHPDLLPAKGAFKAKEL